MNKCILNPFGSIPMCLKWVCLYECIDANKLITITNCKVNLIMHHKNKQSLQKARILTEIKQTLSY